MLKTALRQAINQIVREWQTEGDTASAIELWYDACIRLRIHRGRYRRHHIGEVQS